MDYPYKSKVLDRLGVRSWINAGNWSTVVGGTWIDDRVLDAMNEVAKTFVDMHELIANVDERIAALCKVDEAHITTGTGAAMGLAVAGCMAGNDHGKWMRLPDTDGMKNEVVNPRGHHIVYTPQWTVSGATLVEYGQAGTLGSIKRELESAITVGTCCLTYTASYNVVPRGMIPLDEVIEAGKDHGIPVVVDAASMLPPVANLHKYADMGADIVCFSGGKAIKAPNNTGMMLGKGRGAEIVRAVRAHSFPHAGWGRGYKISKEQIVGLLVALEIFVEEGDSLYAEQMETAEYFEGELRDIPGVDVCIMPNDESFHEHVFTPRVPRVLLRWDAREIGLTGKDVDEAMASEDPPVFLRNSKYFTYFTDKEWRQIDTYYLREEEAKIVSMRLKKILRGGGSR
jgi:D-glucosaminate-6-phosphate ammonia-lyase